jgi:hypothetical protein
MSYLIPHPLTGTAVDWKTDSPLSIVERGQGVRWFQGTLSIREEGAGGEVVTSEAKQL